MRVARIVAVLFLLALVLVGCGSTAAPKTTATVDDTPKLDSTDKRILAGFRNVPAGFDLLTQQELRDGKRTLPPGVIATFTRTEGCCIITHGGPLGFPPSVSVRQYATKQSAAQYSKERFPHLKEVPNYEPTTYRKSFVTVAGRRWIREQYETAPSNEDGIPVLYVVTYTSSERGTLRSFDWVMAVLNRDLLEPKLMKMFSTVAWDKLPLRNETPTAG